MAMLLLSVVTLVTSPFPFLTFSDIHTALLEIQNEYKLVNTSLKQLN